MKIFRVKTSHSKEPPSAWNKNIDLPQFLFSKKSEDLRSEDGSLNSLTPPGREHDRMTDLNISTYHLSSLKFLRGQLFPAHTHTHTHTHMPLSLESNYINATDSLLKWNLPKRHSDPNFVSNRVRSVQLRKNGIFKAPHPSAWSISKSPIHPPWFCLSVCPGAICHIWRSHCTSDWLWKLFATLTQLLQHRLEVGIPSGLLKHPGYLGLKLQILSLV